MTDKYTFSEFLGALFEELRDIARAEVETPPTRTDFEAALRADPDMACPCGDPDCAGNAFIAALRGTMEAGGAALSQDEAEQLIADFEAGT